MKKILFIFSLLFSLHTFSQSEAEISSIKSKVETVNAQYKNYTSIALKSDAEKKEVFTDNFKSVTLIRETYTNESGKTIIWNYIENNHPYFILKEYFTFKLPATDKNFDASDFTKTEEAFYLVNDRIIRWVKDKKAVKKYPKNAATIENNMIEHIAGLMEEYLQQQTK